MDTRKPNLAAPCTDDTIKVRRSDQQNYLNATLQDRDAFNSEGVSWGSSPQIMFVFFSADAGTPKARKFEIYLPRNITTGIHPFKSTNKSIEILFVESYPESIRYPAVEGVINLYVDAINGKYSGTLNVVFKDPQNRTFTSEGEFSFTMKP